MLAATFVKAGSIFERHSILLTVILCFAVSLAIEIVQAWVPSRSSDSIDLMLNTLGGFSGAMMYKHLMAYGARLKVKNISHGPSDKSAFL